MNTSKSLNEILRTLYDIGRHEEAGGLTDRKAAFSEAKQAIVEAVEGLIPPEHGSYSHIESDNQAKGWNQCRDKMLQAIKEWQ